MVNIIHGADIPVTIDALKMMGDHALRILLSARKDGMIGYHVPEAAISYGPEIVLRRKQIRDITEDGIEKVGVGIFYHDVLVSHQWLDDATQKKEGK